MEVFVVNESEYLTSEMPVEDSIPWEEVTFWVGIGAIVAALLGIVGNTLCFITAPKLPDSTTQHLIRYLAVWDALRATQSVLLPNVFYRLLQILGGLEVGVLIFELCAFLKRLYYRMDQ